MFWRKYQSCAKCVRQVIQCRFHINKEYSTKSQTNYKTREDNKLNNLIEKYENKIIYNTFIDSLKPRISYSKRTVLLRKKQYFQEKLERLKLQTHEPLPVTLKYFTESKETGVNSESENYVEQHEIKPTHFPFGDESAAPIFSTINKQQMHTEHRENVADATDKEIKERQKLYEDVNYSKWMMDYENYEDMETEENEVIDSWKINYGTPDPNSKISNVPCGGCGALLHCKDTAIPGYIPSEIYTNSFKREGVHLKALVCQRCHFLKHYNLALQVRVSSEDYPKVLETIRDKKALVILVVDLLDFPCSIWPGIMNTLGAHRPIVLVGNKVDLLPRDSQGYLERIKENLKENVQKMVGKRASTNIKHVALVSAKTGWGIEELITKLQNLWGSRGDVYLVGCTNVGKSSLFNCLLQSDYCKIQAVDLVQRATTSLWPGTTLNLLKFPILRPSGWRLYVRTKRLMSARKVKAAEEKLSKVQLQMTKDLKYATLMGHIDRTFLPESNVGSSTDPFAVQGSPNASGKVRLGINENDPIYASSKWFYDTPGVVRPEQIIHLLTAEELTLALPRKLIRPQTFGVRLGQTLFIAGMGRVDYIEGPASLRLTVFCAETLPITICPTENAETLYEELLGTDLFQVPKGSAERMNSWPGLKAVDCLKLTADERYKSCGDIVLSSAGWIAVTCDYECEVTFRAWTPEARGIYLRKSLLPCAVGLRGNKIRHSPAYMSNKFYVPK